MAQHDYVIDNSGGFAFRADINSVLAAIVSLNSGSAEPSTKYAYQLWGDTTNDLLKIRNAANNAWIVVGKLSAVNLGLAPIENPSFTGTAGIAIPSGTTAQRPSSPGAGTIRWNSSLTRWEGYNGTAWVGFTVA
jgi:hypothetical protein